MRWTGLSRRLLLSVGLLAATASCAPDAGWSVPEEVAPSQDGRPYLGFDRDGDTVIVWTELKGNTSRTIYAAHHRAGTGITTPVVLAESTARRSLGGVEAVGGIPWIATGPEGATLVGWNQVDGAGSRPALRRYTPATGWSETEFPPADPATTGAAFAGDGNGGVLLAWTTTDHVRVRALGPNGWGETVTVGVRVVEDRPNRIGFPNVAVDARGRAVVIWWYTGTDGLRSTAGVRGTRRDEAGRWSDPSWIESPSRACCFAAGPGLDASGRAWFATEESDPYSGPLGVSWKFTDGDRWNSVVAGSSGLAGSAFDGFGPPTLLLVRSVTEADAPGGSFTELTTVQYTEDASDRLHVVGRLRATPASPAPRHPAVLARSADGTEFAAWSEGGVWVATRLRTREWIRARQIAPEGCPYYGNIVAVGGPGSTAALAWLACGQLWVSRYSR